MRPRLLTAVLRRVASADASADLLARFRATRDDAAFAELVRRHARLVWGVCRNLLPAEADAEDAFQATFLALYRSADKLRDDRAVPGWLHATAVRVCLQSRRAAGRRHRHEQQASSPEASAPVADSRWADVLAAVHEEVNRLPTPLRTAFVACCLEGRGQTEAAAFLGWKLGTLSGRLTRAKQTILDRLDRRGLVPAVGLAALSATSNAPARAVTAAIGVTHGSGSATVLELARRATGGAMNAKMWAAAVVAAAIGIGGGGVWLSRTEAQAPGGKRPPVAEPDPKPGAYQIPFMRHRVEYLTVKRESADQATFAEQLRKHGGDGWVFAGTELLVPAGSRDAVSHLVFHRQTGDARVVGYYDYPMDVPPKRPDDAIRPAVIPPPPKVPVDAEASTTGGPQKTVILNTRGLPAGDVAKALSVALGVKGEVSVAPVDGAGAVVLNATEEQNKGAVLLILELWKLADEKVAEERKRKQ